MFRKINKITHPDLYEIVVFFYTEISVLLWLWYTFKVFTLYFSIFKQGVYLFHSWGGGNTWAKSNFDYVTKTVYYSLSIMYDNIFLQSVYL